MYLHFCNSTFQMMVGIGVGIFFFILLIAVGVACCIRKRKQQEEQKNELNHLWETNPTIQVSHKNVRPNIYLKKTEKNVELELIIILAITPWKLSWRRIRSRCNRTQQNQHFPGKQYLRTVRIGKKNFKIVLLRHFVNWKIFVAFFLTFRENPIFKEYEFHK